MHSEGAGSFYLGLSASENDAVGSFAVSFVHKNGKKDAAATPQLNLNNINEEFNVSIL